MLSPGIRSVEKKGEKRQWCVLSDGHVQIHFQGSLNGSFSVILFSASVAILIGSKPEGREGESAGQENNELTVVVIRQRNGSFLISGETTFTRRRGWRYRFFLLLDIVLDKRDEIIVPLSSSERIGWRDLPSACAPISRMISRSHATMLSSGLTFSRMFCRTSSRCRSIFAYFALRFSSASRRASAT